MVRYLFGLLVVAGLIGGGIAFFSFENNWFTEDEGQAKRLDVIGSVLEVGGQVIEEADIDWEFRFYLSSLADDLEGVGGEAPQKSDETQLAPLREKLLSEFIERKLLYTYLAKDGSYDLSRPELYTECLAQWSEVIASKQVDESLLSSSKDRERLKHRLCEWHVIQAYLVERVFGHLTVPLDEAEQYYLANKQDFYEPVKVQIRQIVLPSEKEANALRHQVNNSNFADLAARHSITPESKNGGLLPAFSSGDLPRFFNVAFSMRPGEIRGVLKSTYGFHIIRLENRFPAKQLGFQEVQDKINAKLLAAKKEKEYERWLELAINAIPIKSPNQIL